MDGEVRAFQSHESRPDDDCKPATAVVASTSRMAAVDLLRRHGFGTRDVKEAKRDSAEELAALQQSGVVLWCDWSDVNEERVWHRV